jgi:uncharacterized protein YbjT (DUF2867 family)
MAVLVTGATGLVGINLLGRLLGSGEEVVSLSAPPMQTSAKSAM